MCVCVGVSVHICVDTYRLQLCFSVLYSGVCACIAYMQLCLGVDIVLIGSMNHFLGLAINVYAQTGHLL